MLKIALLVDNPQSWFVPYGRRLATKLERLGHDVVQISTPDDLPGGDLAFVLSCERIVGAELRSRHRHNLVIHASALPKGRGWSPLTWQILEGKNDIQLTIFEAEEDVDSGVIYGSQTIRFEGNELLEELHQKEGDAIVDLAMWFVEKYPDVTGTPQIGEPSFYPRRRPADSELDPNLSLKELFNLVRVVDNQRYPAFFRLAGSTYTIKVEKREEERH